MQLNCIRAYIRAQAQTSVPPNTISTHDAKRLMDLAALLLATEKCRSQSPLLLLTVYRESRSKEMAINHVIVAAYEYQEIADTKQTNLSNFPCNLPDLPKTDERGLWT